MMAKCHNFSAYLIREKQKDPNIVDGRHVHTYTQIILGAGPPSLAAAGRVYCLCRVAI